MGRQVPAKTEALGMETEILTSWKMESKAQKAVDTRMCVHTHSQGHPWVSRWFI